VWPTISTHINLYHGCTKLDALRITAGVNSMVGHPQTDFGRGFYTTTRGDQAEEWAVKRYQRKYPLGNPLDPPAVIRFRVPLAALADLNSLAFVRGDPGHEMFWSLVTHCRGGNSHVHPVRVAPDDWYDMVSGPVAGLPLAHRHTLGDWDGTNFAAYDQYSFHTTAAANVLNAVPRGNPADFEVTELLLPP
jgi:hypothetical protein